jgi:hypothetical protein
MFELSSGSTAAPSSPYTDSLKAEFQRGITWIYDLYTNNRFAAWPPVSITPLTDGKRCPAGIPIGFESDSAYLGILGKWLVDSVMAVPDTVKHISNIDSFRYVTLLCLLRQPDLRLISVWNPTFLSLLLWLNGGKPVARYDVAGFPWGCDLRSRPSLSCRALELQSN